MADSPLLQLCWHWEQHTLLSHAPAQRFWLTPTPSLLASALSPPCGRQVGAVARGTLYPGKGSL